MRISTHRHHYQYQYHNYGARTSLTKLTPTEIQQQQQKQPTYLTVVPLIMAKSEDTHIVEEKKYIVILRSGKGQK